jgi:hypothetical protein
MPTLSVRTVGPADARPTADTADRVIRSGAEPAPHGATCRARGLRSGHDGV